MSEENTNTDANAGETPPPPPVQQGTVSKILGHVTSNKVEAGLWVTRLFTVVCVFNFFIPLWLNPADAYHKALLSNAATSALRLHQRLPQVQLSREFFGRLLLEDSAHYLFYSIIFLTSSPLTKFAYLLSALQRVDPRAAPLVFSSVTFTLHMVLVPMFLFAVLHAQNYTKQLLNMIGPNSVQLLRNLLDKLSAQQVNILRFIAINEIFLMPASIVMIFTGYGTLLLPFIYYRFLSLRYGSQRNPYCRQVFYELRVSVEQLINHPKCPQAVRPLVNKAIAFISRLAPQVAPQPQPQQ